MIGLRLRKSNMTYEVYVEIAMENIILIDNNYDLCAELCTEDRHRMQF